MSADTSGPDNLQRVEITCADALWTWLETSHVQPGSVWLVTWKKADPRRYVSRDEVLDALIAYGWIDGRRKALDAARTMQLISPRKQQAWAQTYKDRAARLIADRRMKAPGEAAIARSKAAGLWEASASVDVLEVPADLEDALTAQPPAARHWAAFAPSYRRNLLRWLASAKRPGTRAARIGKIVTATSENTKIPNF